MSMRSKNGNTDESVRIFDNSLLESLTHVHPLVPLILWGPIIGYLLYVSIAVVGMSRAEIFSIGVFGFIVWTLTEYLLHRYLFHFDGTSEFSKKMVFLIHGIHHHYPNDASRLVMPPVPGVVLAGIFYVLFYLLLGSIWVKPFFAFFLIGYLCYDYIHFSTHHFKPRTPVGKYLKQYHMLHHFQTPDARYGVSNPLWDYIIGTQESKTNPIRRKK